MKQRAWAKEEMVKWLSHERELGRKPAKIVCTKEIIVDDLIYYIFKFKKGFFDKYWLIGVVGGYEKDKIEHCGHILSEYQDYDEEMEEVYARRMIDMIKDCWKEREIELSKYN